MFPWYATRDGLKRALDVKQTARSDPEVDRAVGQASRTAEGELQRPQFYPEDVTLTFQEIGFNHRSCRPMLFLEQYEMVTVDSITVDGTTVELADVVLRPQSGPPFSRIQFAEAANVRPGQREVVIAGTRGHDDRTAPAGELAAAVDDTGTTVDVSDASKLGVGDLLTIGGERMVVAGRAMLATGQTLADSLAAQHADRTLTVADGSQIHAGEVLLVDAERMLATEISGNDVLVRRAWDGSVLAAHSSGAAVLAERRLTVERGVLGTTVAAHALGAAVARQVYPEQLVAYVVALAEDSLLREVTGQTHQAAGSGGQTVLEMARDRAMRELGRPFLVR